MAVVCTPYSVCTGMDGALLDSTLGRSNAAGGGLTATPIGTTLLLRCSGGTLGEFQLLCRGCGLLDWASHGAVKRSQDDDTSGAALASIPRETAKKDRWASKTHVEPWIRMYVRTPYIQEHSSRPSALQQHHDQKKNSPTPLPLLRFLLSNTDFGPPRATASVLPTAIMNLQSPNVIGRSRRCRHQVVR